MALVPWRVFTDRNTLVGRNKPLRKVVEGDVFSSLIFFGPPGTGKTALARIIAATTKARFRRLNAVSAGVSDVRAVIEEAKEIKTAWDRKTILFIDEIHRFNKAQQDALLPAVEEGLIYLIGATTENPFFYIIPPLLSRSLLFTFESLSVESLKKLLLQAISDKERGLGKLGITLEEEALQFLAGSAGGDARNALNVLEMVTATRAFNTGKAGVILQLQDIKEVLQKKYLKYDKHGDYHYDSFLPFINPFAVLTTAMLALYWLERAFWREAKTRFFTFGARRLIISATAKTSAIADPAALPLAVAASQAIQQIGMPEGAHQPVFR